MFLSIVYIQIVKIFRFHSFEGSECQLQIQIVNSISYIIFDFESYSDKKKQNSKLYSRRSKEDLH